MVDVTLLAGGAGVRVFVIKACAPRWFSTRNCSPGKGKQVRGLFSIQNKLFCPGIPAGRWRGWWAGSEWRRLTSENIRDIRRKRISTAAWKGPLLGREKGPQGLGLERTGKRVFGEKRRKPRNGKSESGEGGGKGREGVWRRVNVMM